MTSVLIGWRFVLTAAAVFWFVPRAGRVDRDDELPVAESKGDDAASLKKILGKKTAEEDGKSTTDETSLFEEDQPDFMEQAVGQLQKVARDLQRARERVEAEKTGAETRQFQQRAIDDLEELKKLVERRQNQMSKKKQSKNSKSKPSSSKSERQESQQKDANDPQNSEGSNSQNQDDKEGGKERRDGKANDANEQLNDSARRPQEEEARRVAIIKDVWGHLPPHVREAMLNSLGEKYLPKYEELVKKYYEDLAEKNRKNRGK